MDSNGDTSESKESPFSIELSVLERDKDIYPRQQLSHKTIENYAEALRAGAAFPPIEIQRIQDNGAGRVIVLDGWHRLAAHEQVERETIRARYWREEILNKEEDFEELLKASVKFNLTHGDRLTESDFETVALKILDRRSVDEVRGLKTDLADYFAITPAAVSQWEEFSKEYNKKIASRDSLIYRLAQLGWTQQEIADVVGLSRQGVGENAKKLSTKVSGIRHLYHDEQKSVDEIAEFERFDSVAVWSMTLEGENDITRFDRLGRSPPIYDIWSFGARDKKYGQEAYKWGLITGQIVENLLYLYTDQGDLVLDPMAGGGTTNDVCVVFNRRCAAFDIEPVRKDIRQHDITTGPPPVKEPVQLAILEPPYYNMKQDAYDTLEEYHEFLRTAIANTAECLRPDGILALIIMDQVNKEQQKYPIIGPSYRHLMDTGLEYEHLVGLPLGTQQFTGFRVNRAKEGKFMLGINRQMWLFRRATE